MTERGAFEHIVWDWNGTLFNDAGLCRDVMNRMLRKRGMPEMTAERYQKVFDFPVREYYRRLGYDFTRESFETLGSEFMAGYERCRLECGLQPGAREVLEQIRGAGFRQSLLSAYRADTLEELLVHFGVRELFDHVIGADDHYASGKIERGLQWTRSTGLSPGRILLVGDTVHDYEVAAALGAACWLIPCGNHTRERLERCGVPVLRSLRDVPGRLQAHARGRS
jgi:phosphoglycolate phosphatase